MESKDLYSLKFPVGEFDCPKVISDTQVSSWIKIIADFPEKISSLTRHLSGAEKSWKYRPEGWMIKQVVHHCSDSHINSFCRFKLALTEDNPTIRPYEEQLWAELIDGKDDDLTDSLNLLFAVHSKWVKLLESLTKDQLNLTFRHPASGEIKTLKENIGIYAWHCNHHEAHINQALKSKGGY